MYVYKITDRLNYLQHSNFIIYKKFLWLLLDIERTKLELSQFV